MKTVDRERWYCVLDMRTKEVVYCGTQSLACAAAGEPGTCWGIGYTEAQARVNALTILENCEDNDRSRCIGVCG